MIRLSHYRCMYVCMYVYMYVCKYLSGDVFILFYMYIDPGSTNSFVVNSSTGCITLSSSLDRETVPSYNFIVRVSDYIL